MFDPSLSSALAIGIETVINTALKFDPGTRTQLKALSDKTLCFTLSDIRLSIYLNILEEELYFILRQNTEIDSDTAKSLGPSIIDRADNQLDVDVKLSAKSTQFLNTLFDEPKNFKSAGLDIEGDVHLLADFHRIIKQLDIDWEDALSKFAGPHLSPLLSIPLRAITSKLMHQRRNIDTLTHFFTQEYSLIPQKIEFEQFSTGIHQARIRAERLEAKLTQAKAKSELNP